MTKNIFLLSLLILTLVGLIVGGYFYHESTKPPTDVACTLEALICPDGTAVGRTGPRCEFAPCPLPQVAEGWDQYTDFTTGLSLRAPTQLPTIYRQAVDWPPQLQLAAEEYSCEPAGQEIEPAGQTREKTILGRDYCITTVTEGAVGSIYQQYDYTFPYGSGTAKLIFSTRASQCGNYSTAEQGACEAEGGRFDLDQLIDQIAQSIK